MGHANDGSSNFSASLRVNRLRCLAFGNSRFERRDYAALERIEQGGVFVRRIFMIDRIPDGRTDLVFDFLVQGHAPDSKDKNGVSLMQWCAYYGDVSAIKFLCSQGASLHALGENFDLNGASFHGHWQLCQHLIENGANVNHSQPDTGETPLHSAICKANRPAYNHVLKVLLANGANPNCKTTAGIETGSFMRDCRTRGETPLHRAAAFGTEETIQLLLDAGAILDAKDANGDSPLTWASWHLRPAAILRKLCYGRHSIHPKARWTSDHGMGWGNGMETHLLGEPRVERT
jgi:ankyrin repeat protein